MDCGQLETGIVYSLTYEIALGALRAWKLEHTNYRIDMRESIFQIAKWFT
jgi:hypothetical protein